MHKRNLTKNPNRAKHSAARLAQREHGIGRQPVARKFKPGMTVAARERGRERMIERRIAAILVHYNGFEPQEV